MSATKEKPVVVVTAFAASGHSAGPIQIAGHLVSRGFKVYFIGGAEFKSSIEKTGSVYVENPWRWQDVVAQAQSNFDEVWAMKHVFGGPTPASYRILKETLERVRREHPDRELVIFHESMSQGLLPMLLGAPLPERYTELPRIINFHCSIYIATDYSRPPFGPGLPYDPTPENLALWRSIYDEMQPRWDSVNEHCNDIYQSLGATRRTPKGSFFDHVMFVGDVTLLAFSPSLEYPIQNPNPKLRFIGGLPLKPLPDSFVYPPWWPTIAANAALPAGSPDRKKVVFVAQGTVHLDYTELIVPTIRALAGREDTIVVATLGSRGAKLGAAAMNSTTTNGDNGAADGNNKDGDFSLPDNAIVTDYLPYDALLPHTDVFVCNAGFGGFMHGVMNGVPMVLAGAAADKAEVSARAERAGVAINLRAQKPSPDAIRAAVDRVLTDPSFKRRAVELRRENEEMDSLGQIEAVIDEVLGRK